MILFYILTITSMIMLSFQIFTLCWEEHILWFDMTMHYSSLVQVIDTIQYLVDDILFADTWSQVCFIRCILN